jgi:DNA-binding transcriptional ArsR family regulator
MPRRQIIAKKLAKILKVVSHADRIRLIEELHRGEMDVNTLAGTLSLPGPRILQHLSLLRAHRIVEQRRDGRHHIYKLIQPEIARWIVDGITFVEGCGNAVPKSKINPARRL